jgi:YHS domain-containing protein
MTTGTRAYEVGLGSKEWPMEIDPVCSMDVDPRSAAGSFEYQGKTYYFCSEGCLEDFREDPESYVGS